MPQEKLVAKPNKRRPWALHKTAEKRTGLAQARPRSSSSFAPLADDLPTFSLSHLRAAVDVAPLLLSLPLSASLSSHCEFLAAAGKVLAYFSAAATVFFVHLTCFDTLHAPRSYPKSFGQKGRRQAEAPGRGTRNEPCSLRRWSLILFCAPKMQAIIWWATTTQVLGNSPRCPGQRLPILPAGPCTLSYPLVGSFQASLLTFVYLRCAVALVTDQQRYAKVHFSTTVTLL